MRPAGGTAVVHASRQRQRGARLCARTHRDPHFSGCKRMPRHDDGGAHPHFRRGQPLRGRADGDERSEGDEGERERRAYPEGATQPQQ